MCTSDTNPLSHPGTPLQMIVSGGSDFIYIDLTSEIFYILSSEEMSVVKIV